ncbi:hypothetical protein H8356DRAFT_955872 [Neocallimastix lanati (nom. inval.)]|nr:hypothetical protein H8356DRAFT_955872 [Neocallimastix sp. JGI-2020a]
MHKEQVNNEIMEDSDKRNTMETDTNEDINLNKVNMETDDKENINLNNNIINNMDINNNNNNNALIMNNIIQGGVIYKNLNDINYIPSIIPNLYDVENNTVDVNHHSSPLTTNIHFNTFVNQCKSASPRLNILYVNARGFSKYKQKYIFNSLLYIYDIIFIIETWIINYIELLKNPNLLASTPIKEKRV